MRPGWALLPLSFWRALQNEQATICAPANGNVAVGSHGEYFPTLTAAAA